MATIKLSAPIGQTPRVTDGAEVKNKGADVQLVRKMLEANGIGPLGDSKKMDAGLLKAIGVFQKKIGFKWPDKVIDPDGRTFAKLLPAYAAQVKAEEKIKMYKVRWDGKDLLLKEKDLQKLRKDVLKRLKPYVTSLLKSHERNLKTFQEYLDTAMLKDGVMQAVTQTIIMQMRWSPVKFPDSALATRSITASGALERAFKSKDLTAIDKTLPEAEKAINAFTKDVLRFLNDFTGAAKTTATVLQVTSATCFGIVGVLGAPVLVTGAGMSAGAAAVTSGASVGVLQSASQELGKHASGQKVTAMESVWAMVVDGTIGGLTAGVGNKLPLGFIDDAAKAMAPKALKLVPWASQKSLEKTLVKFLSGTGQETVKEGVNAGIKLAGEMMKSGKVPTEKQIQKAFEDVLFAGLTKGILGNLGSFQKKWAYQSKASLQGQILPARFAKFAKANEVPNTIKAKMWADVANKLSEDIVKAGYGTALESFTGKESDTQLVDIALKAMNNDKKLIKKIDAELEKAAKKHKVQLK